MKRKVIIALIVCAVSGMIISLSVGQSASKNSKANSSDQQVVGPESIILAADSLI